MKSFLLSALLALLSLDRFLTACGAADRKQMQSAHQGFEAAVDQWIELDLNPAKILSIFPESIAGQGLSRPRSAWVSVWGAELSDAGFSLDEVEPERSRTTAAAALASSKRELTTASATQQEGAARDRSRFASLPVAAAKLLPAANNLSHDGQFDQKRVM